MPWKECHVMDERLRFVARLLEGEKTASLTCMHYDLGYFDGETCRLEPIENPFGSKVLPIRSE
jgi:hypothetical protein